MYLAEALDGTKNGTVDYTLLVAALLTQKELQDEGRSGEAFAVFDFRRCGSVSAEDLKRVLGARDPALQVSRCAKMIAEFDLDGDGALNRSEFEAMICGKSEAVDDSLEGAIPQPR